VRVVAANHGWQWLAAGWQLFRASPGMWILTVFAYLFLVVTISRLHFVAQIAMAVLLPAFSMSFMVTSSPTSARQ
jgi:hypothetical protein